jgi:hypothetical protein
VLFLLVVIVLVNLFSKAKEMLTGKESLNDPLCTLALVMLAIVFPTQRVCMCTRLHSWRAQTPEPYSSMKMVLTPLVHDLMPNSSPSLTEPLVAILQELEELLSMQL